jgi:hypothetical protein
VSSGGSGRCAANAEDANNILFLLNSHMFFHARETLWGMLFCANLVALCAGSPTTNCAGSPTTNCAGSPTTNGAGSPTTNGAGSPTTNGAGSPTTNGAGSPTTNGAGSPTTNGAGSPTTNSTQSSVKLCSCTESSRCAPPASSNTFQRDSAWQSTRPHWPLYSGLPSSPCTRTVRST